MIPLDYGRSFILSTAARNEVRFWVESRTRIIDEQTGAHEDYIQVGSCKGERTFVPSNLFREDNYDFLPIFGPQYSIAFRRKPYLNSQYKECLLSQDFPFGGPQYYLQEGTNVEQLPDNEAIRTATYACTPIVSQTEIWNDQTHLRALIECPAKTINTRRQGDVYQVDTGPIAFPDLSMRHPRYVDGISLAFIAFNAPHFADFVLEVPTTIGPEGQSCEVHHYSHLLGLTARNTMWAVGD
ncbi:MAG: hypothetical protein GKR89_29400 [Candidatus Latescibacteria bacterium]|nr:hypothetical protein [Candidatus Latescibacterota bacterium]